MSIRPFRDIKRNKTKVINVGPVKVGGNNPISVQSMTNTLTTDVNKTIKQIHQISEAGADIVRVSCPDENSTNALKEIVKAHLGDDLFTQDGEKIKKLIRDFIDRRSGGDLATDQLLNAIYIVTRDLKPEREDEDNLIEELLKYLTSEEDR